MGKMKSLDTNKQENSICESNLVYLISIMQRARDNGKRYPVITFKTAEFDLTLKLQGPNSKYFGSASVTDGGPYGNCKFYGRIMAEGEFVPAPYFKRTNPQLIVNIRNFLAAVCEEPNMMFRDQGYLTGHCCFCGRELTNEFSKMVGMGPDCREKFGIEGL